MGSQATTDGLMTLTVTFKLGTDPDKAQQLVQNRVSQAEPRLPEEVRRLGVTTVKSSPDLTMVVHLRVAQRPLRHDLPAQLRGAQRQGPAGAHRRAWARCSCSARGDYSMRVWLDPQKVAQRGLSASDVVRAIREQNVQAAAGVVGASPGLPGRRPAAVDQRAGPPAERGGVRRHHRQDRRRRRGDAAARRRRASSWARPTTRCARCSTTSRRSAVADLPGARLQRASQISDNVRATMAELKKNMPEGVDYEHRLRPDAVRARLDRVGGAHAARSRSRWWCWW